MLVGLTSDLFGHVPFAAAQITAPANQVVVIDAATLRLNGVLVRLGGLIAPARGEACAAGPDCGGRASVALAALVRDAPVACRIIRYGLDGEPVARCQAAGRDVNAALVGFGWARAEAPEFAPDLAAAQSEARAHRRGIWLAG